MSHVRLRRVALTALFGAIALTLAACLPPVPQPSTTPSLGDPGAVLVAQSDRIVSSTASVLAAADAASDPSLFSERVSGDAAAARTAEYIIAANGGSNPDVIPAEIQAVYTVSSDSWPRVMAAVTEAADAAHTPVVLVWEQAGPRDDFQLRWWAHMIPGGVLPAMPGQSTGTEQLPLDAPGFVSTPAKAIDDYVALLNAGASSELESAFAPDPYRARMFAARTLLAATVTPRSGSYTNTFTAQVNEAYVLADAEGGALIFLPLDVVSDFNVPGGQLTLPTADKSLLQGTLGSRVVHRYLDFVVLRLPKSGTGSLPGLAAADQHLVSVATS